MEILKTKPKTMILKLFLVLPLLLPHNYASAQRLSSLTDRTGLFLLRSSLGVRSKYWPRRSDPCSSWLGIECNSGRVTAVNLSSLRRTRLGRRHSSFSVDGLRNLTRLESLNSTGFALPGPIPAWLGSRLPPSFSVLVLRSSNVNGTIPSALADLTNLKLLDLSSNSLSGQIPPQIGLARNLKTLIVSGNALSGSIPDAIWSLELDLLDFSGNNLTGTLPNSNASISVFNLSNNQYYGPVSAEFGIYLQRLDLSDNYFEGTVPMEKASAVYVSNCFRNATGQRSLVECEDFYRGKGVAFDSPSLSPAGKKSQTWKYILGGVVGFVGIVSVAVLVSVLFLMRSGARTSERDREGVSPVASGADPPPPSRMDSKNLPAAGETFTYEQLVRATSDFSGTNLIKKGHSGDLYRGVLEGGFSVVVKRVDLSVVREGYAAELDIFARASHTRLVPFLGQCSDVENERFLVYKYMMHRDLSSALYKKPKKKPEQDEEGLASLDWITRSKIAIGVAEALCFLHHECNPQLVHRDVQASSILLDDKFEVRLGSLSEVCAQEGDSHQNVFTRFLRRSKKSEEGAFGPLAATCANDVYCLGKVLLELVTGKLGISESNSYASEWLDHTLQSINTYDRESVAKIIDPSLILDEDLVEEAWAMAVMAKSCLNPKPSKRPLVRHVLKALENPLKVVRTDSRMSTAQLRTTSSRGSWHGAFFGSWRRSSSDIVPASGPLREDRSLRRSSTVRSHERGLREIFPEPLGEVADVEVTTGSSV